MYNFLFFDSNRRSVYAQIRSIKQYFGNQCVVHVIDRHKYTGGRHSKYVNNWRYTPTLNRESILKYCQSARIDVIYISDEYTIHWFGVQRLFDELQERGCKISVYSYPLFLASSDKYKVMQLAEGVNNISLKVPKYLYIKTINDINIEAIQKDFSFPVVIKPQYSIAVGENLKQTSVCIAKDSTELKKAMLVNLHENIPFMVQEYISGTGIGLEVILDENQNILAEFAHQRIRELHLNGGGSTYCKSIPVKPSLRSDILSLLHQLKWVGPAMIEVKKTASGDYYLMEINARFWGSLELPIFCGVNFPVIWTSYLLGLTYETNSKPSKFKERRARWIRGDLVNIAEVIRKRQDPLGQKINMISYLSEFLVPSENIPTTSMELKLDDLQYFLGQLIGSVTKVL